MPTGNWYNKNALSTWVERFCSFRLYLIIHHLYGLQPEEYDLNIYTFEEYMKLLMRKE